MGRLCLILSPISRFEVMSHTFADIWQTYSDNTGIPGVLCRVNIVRKPGFLTLGNCSPIVLRFFEESSISDLRQTISGLINQSLTGFQICTEYRRDLPDDISIGKLKQDIRRGILTFEVRDRQDNFYLFVKSLTGMFFMIDVFSGNDSILEIKRRIQNKEGIPPETQRFVCSGKSLDEGMRIPSARTKTSMLICEDHRSLADYNIQKVSLEAHISLSQKHQPRYPLKSRSDLQTPDGQQDHSFLFSDEILKIDLSKTELTG